MDLSSSAKKLRRVLIVSPHFPPVNAPDHQRVRMALPWLARHGWQAEILAVAPEFVEAARDEELAAALPPEAKVHRVPAISPTWTRRLGWGSLARRSYGYLKERGSQLLASGRFDLVFFSTSQFGVLPLALEWMRRFRIPYVLDFQDEWISDYYQRNRRVTPPGGRCKYFVSQTRAAWQEGPVVRGAAGLVVVAQRYRTNLLRRHSSLTPDRIHVLPFGGAPEDFASKSFVRTDWRLAKPVERMNWVYVGRGGAAIHVAVEAFFHAMRRAFANGIVVAAELRLHCLGTDYATGDRARETFAPLARALGLAAQVHEETARLPHFAALRCLREADALIVFGSDDPGYSASKIIPYLFARRPLLAIFHEASDCVRVLRETGAGTLVTFASGEAASSIGDRIFDAWFAARRFLVTPHVSPAALAPHTAEAMTHRLCTVFDASCAAAQTAV